MTDFVIMPHPILFAVPYVRLIERYKCVSFFKKGGGVLNYPRVVSVRYSYSDSDFFDHKPLGVCSDKPNKPTHVYT